MKFRFTHFGIESVLLAIGMIITWRMLTYLPLEGEKNWFAYSWDGLLAHPGALLPASAPLAAAGAAFAGARLRSGKIWLNVSSRSRITIAIQSLLPTVVAATLIQATAFTVYLVNAEHPGVRPNLLIPLAYTLVIAFHLFFGFFLGLKISRLIAIPLAGLVSYQILGQSGATMDFSLRYISGMFLFPCCSIDRMEAPWALWPAIAFNGIGAAGLAFACLVSLKATPKPIKFISLALVPVLVIGGFMVGKATALGAEAYPTVHRPLNQLICFGNAPEVCLYPGQDSNRHIVMAAIKAWIAIHDLGLRIPTRVTFSGGEYNPPEIAISANPDSSDGAVVWNLIRAIATRLPAPEQAVSGCTSKSANEASERDLNRSTLISYLISAVEPQFPAISLPDRHLPVDFAAKIKANMAVIHTWSQQQRTTWLNAARKASRNCSDVPKVLP